MLRDLLVDAAPPYAKDVHLPLHEINVLLEKAGASANMESWLKRNVVGNPEYSAVVEAVVGEWRRGRAEGFGPARGRVEGGGEEEGGAEEEGDHHAQGEGDHDGADNVEDGIVSGEEGEESRSESHSSEEVVDETEGAAAPARLSYGEQILERYRQQKSAWTS